MQVTQARKTMQPQFTDKGIRPQFRNLFTKFQRFEFNTEHIAECFPRQSTSKGMTASRYRRLISCYSLSSIINAGQRNIDFI